MYKYKPVRYVFRILNLFVYAVVISFCCLAVVKQLDIVDILNSIFGNYQMTPERSVYLAVFLLANVAFILLFKLFSKKETEAILFYICDFVIRITFSIPVTLIVVYFLIYRFCPMFLDEGFAQGILALLLFLMFDGLMRVQIRYQLGVNYFKVNDKV